MTDGHDFCLYSRYDDDFSGHCNAVFHDSGAGHEIRHFASHNAVDVEDIDNEAADNS